jgi:adenosine deaminase
MSTTPDRHEWIRALPKAELHLHLEGSLEPEMLFAMAARNHVDLPFATIAEVRAAYEFERLDDFLAIYYQGMSVLQTQEDFRELTFAYMQRAHLDGVVHAEVFFDPQGHTRRGIAFATVIDGILAGMQQAERELKMTSRLIMCFLRDLDESDALATLEAAHPYLESLTGVGLDSSELGHPPAKFKRVFALARQRGLRLVAHAGEEGPPAYVTEALDVLGVDRLDHGNRSLEDAALTQRLRESQITLTVCPLSNLKLGGIKDLRQHPLKAMLHHGLHATINSDDPAYFGGYIHDNFVAAAENLQLSKSEIVTLVKNSIQGSFLDETDVRRHLAAIDAMVAASA